MAECAYYAKAVFPSEAQAKRESERIRAFLERMAEAERAWLDEHDVPGLFGEYGDVMAGLGLVPLDFTQAAYGGNLASPASDEAWEFHQRGNEVWFKGMVWHFADWEPLRDALRTEFGALAAGWESEDACESSHWGHIVVS